MTEAEAKTKWCPHVRYTNSNGEGINRWVSDRDEALNPMPARCIGSACMAWRWQFRCGENPDNPAEAMSLPPIEGFCGLAGRPA